MRELKKHFELMTFMTSARLEAEASRTYAGYLWWVLDPLLQMVVFYVLFVVLMQRGRADYLHFVFAGLLVWKWIEGSIMTGAQSLERNKGLMGKFYIPKTIFPMMDIFYNTWKFFIVFCVMVLIFSLTGFPFTVYHTTLPLCLMASFALILGMTYLFASLMPFFPDLKFFLTHAFRIVFYLSGIFFDVRTLSPHAQELANYNPIIGMMQSYRDVLMNQHWPDWIALLVCGVVGIACFVIGIRFMQFHDKNYAKLH